MIKIISLVIVGVLLVFLYKVLKTRIQRISKWKIFFWSLPIIVVIIYFLTKNIHVAAITGAIPYVLLIIKRLFSLIRFWRYIKTFRNQKTNKTKSQAMTKTQAAGILDVGENATTEEIVLAHKKMMQKYHPDKGGNDEIAKIINEAKDIMLS